ncbi:hypothetical protein K492DRAFT_199140 [Lichtheimia hyalospora FSU 10163]|nr:hypothetical protein K492DRAFT_199140 [Lichtheimia hyalospora FSU 10163]
MTLSIPDGPFQQPAQQVSFEEHDSVTTMQHSIDSTTLASENNAMGLTNTNAAHDRHGSSLSTSRGYHGDKVLQGTQEDSERRIDFISQLPTDIVLTTLVPMLVDDINYLNSSVPCSYLHVSKLWRDRIIQCLGGLRFSICWEQEDHRDQRCSELIHFAKHTKTLSIDYYDEWMSDLLRDNDLCSLEKITINDISDEHSDSFVSSLKSISTLTHLLLKFGSISIPNLVLTCPHRQALKMREPKHVDSYPLPTTPWSNITTLSLTAVASEIDDDEVDVICKAFPSLKKLDLSPCTDIQSVFIVPKYYPSMKSLVLLIYEEGVGFIYSDQGQPCEEQGITDIAIESGYEYSVTSQELLSLLKQHQRTLVHLEWNTWLDNNEDGLYHIPYPRLKKLSFGYSAFKIPSNAPMLVELNIKANAINNYPAVIDTIPPHLKKLGLTLYPTLSFYDATIIGDYLNQIAQQQDIRLNELVLNIDRMENLDNMFDAIGSLHHLRRLMIGYSDWNVHRLESFLETLVNGCPELDCVKISCKNAPSANAIHTLKRLGHLKELAFSVAHVADGSTFWDSILTLSQLDCIEIYPASAVNKFDIRYLNQYRPDIKVIVHNQSPCF